VQTDLFDQHLSLTSMNVLAVFRLIERHDLKVVATA